MSLSTTQRRNRSGQEPSVKVGASPSSSQENRDFHAEKTPFQPLKRLRPVSAIAISRYSIAIPIRWWGELIKSGQLGMIFGWRGTGKSTFLLALALAMAAGIEFLGFRPSKRARVVLLDGEMDLHSMQKRLRMIKKSLQVKLTDHLKIMSPELFAGAMPKLRTPEGQAEIDQALGDDWDVLIIDNYSSFSSGREDADAWGPWVPWLLKHKRAGRTVIIVHHTGKNGTQRGASNHEDAMDFVMSLREPKSRTHDDALEFVLSWTKSRHLSPKRTQPFQVSLSKQGENEYVWNKTLEIDANQLVAQAKQLRDEGETMTAIAEKLGKDKSTISRWLKA